MTHQEHDPQHNQTSPDQVMDQIEQAFGAEVVRIRNIFLRGAEKVTETLARTAREAREKYVEEGGEEGMEAQSDRSASRSPDLDPDNPIEAYSSKSAAQEAEQGTSDEREPPQGLM